MPAFTVYFTQEELSDLTEFAKEQNKKMSVIVVLALNDYIKKRRLENAKTPRKWRRS